MTRWALLTICCALASMPAIGQDHNLAPNASANAIPLDYQSAQQRLIERSDALAATNADVRSKAATVGATRSLGRPDVDFEGQLLEYQKTLYLPLGSLAPVAQAFGIRDPLQFQRQETAVRPIVTVSLPLYTGGKISATKAGARAKLDQAQADHRRETNKALLQLAKAYYGQQLAEQALAIRRDVLMGLNRHLSDAQKLEREQFISKAQRLQAQVARDDGAREFDKAVADLSTANALLAGLLRAPHGIRPTTPLFVMRQPLEPLAQFKQAALNAHPELHRFRALQAQAQAGVEIERSKSLPTIGAFGQYNFDRRDALLTDSDWAEGVSLRYKIASGLGRNQSVDAARETLVQAEAGGREAAVQIEIGVTKAWNDAEAARSHFQSLDSALASAQENLRLQNLAYREQQATSLDVIDAELGLGRARILRAQAAYDYVTAFAQLLELSDQIVQMPDFAMGTDRELP